MRIEPTVQLTSWIPFPLIKDYVGPVLHPDPFVVKCEHRAAKNKLPGTQVVFSKIRIQFQQIQEA